MVHTLRSVLVFGEMSRKKGCNRSCIGSIVTAERLYLLLTEGRGPAQKGRQIQFMQGNYCHGILPHPFHQTYEALKPLLRSFILPPRCNRFIAARSTYFFILFILFDFSAETRHTFPTLCEAATDLSEKTRPERNPPPHSPTPTPVWSLTSIWKHRWCRLSPAAEPSGWSRLSV